MPSKSFFAQHPIIIALISILLIAIVAAILFLKSTPEEKLAEAGKKMVMPDIKTMKFLIKEITADSLRGQLSININNRLPMTIDVDSLNYKITLEGDTVVQGTSREGIRIEANSNDAISVPVHTNIKNFTKKVEQLERDSAKVSVHAVLYNSFPVVGKKEIPLNFSKTVFIPKLPKMEVQDIKIANLTLQGGKLLVNLKVTNYNPFPYTINGFDYRFRMSDNIQMEGSSEEKFNFTKTGTQVITVPVDLKFNELGETAIDLLFKSKEKMYNMNIVFHVTSTKPYMETFDYAYASTGNLHELKNAVKQVTK